MKYYVQKSCIVQARKFNSVATDVPGLTMMIGDMLCPRCGKRMVEHGSMAGPHRVTVCPDDYIVRIQNGEHTVHSATLFEERYEVIDIAALGKK